MPSTCCMLVDTDVVVTGDVVVATISVCLVGGITGICQTTLLLVIVSTWPPGGRVVVHAEAYVLEVLMHEQDFLHLRKEQPGLAESQEDCLPFSVFSRKARSESVLFIGTQFGNLYTAVDTPARGRVGVCVVFVCLVFACKYVLGHSRVSQPLNLRLCLLRHLGFLTSPYASPTCRRRRLNSYRLLRRCTPDPPPIPWAHPLYLPASPRPPLYTSTMTT
jgi:hypothetical protein